MAHNNLGGGGGLAAGSMVPDYFWFVFSNAILYNMLLFNSGGAVVFLGAGEGPPRPPPLNATLHCTYTVHVHVHVPYSGCFSQLFKSFFFQSCLLLQLCTGYFSNMVGQFGLHRIRKLSAKLYP